MENSAKSDEGRARKRRRHDNDDVDEIEEIPRLVDPAVEMRQDYMKSYDNVINFNKALLLKVVQK